MERGISAGRQLSEVLQKAPFKEAMAKADLFIIPWMSAIELVFDFVGSFFPETDELILEEIIKGFKQVNARLDIIIRELGEIKKLIKWNEMKVKFGDIEYRIRLLDTTLKESLGAPNKKDGINRFIQTFDSEYRNAGFGLYDSTANNDQVFSKNLLTAAMKYSEYERKGCQKFSKGIFGLLLKAASVELASEKFKKQALGMKNIWSGRISRCRVAMQGTDNILEKEAWKGQSKVDAEKTAQALNGKSHGEFSKTLYDYLVEKYYWRHWYVVAYDECDGYYDHASRLPADGILSVKRWGRNYIVVSTDPSSPWDLNKANSYTKNYYCRALPHQCHKDTGKWMLDLSPNYGVAKLVVQAWKAPSMAINAQPGRHTRRRVKLLRPTGGWYNRYDMVYFG